MKNLTVTDWHWQHFSRIFVGLTVVEKFSDMNTHLQTYEHLNQFQMNEYIEDVGAMIGKFFFKSFY